MAPARSCPTRLLVLTALVLWVAAACAGPPQGRLVDMTHAFGDDTIYWPGNTRFRHERTAWGLTEQGYWYASADFTAAEHGGTHLDAPIHFARDRHTLDQIPLDHLIAPAVVVDVRAQCEADRDYAVRVEDLLAWEARHGRIPAGSVVFLFSGWGRLWPDARRYLGSATLEPGSLHFPGLSRDAADFLVTRRAVHGVGIDTASIDPGPSPDFPAHRVLSAANVYALENVAALDRLPPTGATVMALPMKIRGGTGGPVRIIGLVP